MSAQRTDPQRFSGRMGIGVRQHWRKSSQWFSLQRMHAELILADTDMLGLFRRFCHSGWDPDVNRHAQCSSCCMFAPVQEAMFDTEV